MSDEELNIEEAEVTRVTTQTEGSVVDWDASPVIAETEVVTYHVPRGAWDFTNFQRVILAILIWLNIIVLVIGYLVFSGKLSI